MGRGGGGRDWRKEEVRGEENVEGGRGGGGLELKYSIFIALNKFSA